MVARGHSIVFISHKLDEVLEIANRITVLRHGRVTASGVDTQGITKRDLARLMVGREVVFSIDKEPTTPGKVVLSVENVCAENDRGLSAVSDFSLSVRSGEIVGIAAVAGNGQSELAQAITGLRQCTGGRILVNGEQVEQPPTAKRHQSQGRARPRRPNRSRQLARGSASQIT